MRLHRSSFADPHAALLAAALTLGLAACGGDDDAAEPTTPVSAEPVTQPATQPATEASVGDPVTTDPSVAEPAAAAVAVGTLSLGDVLVDANGLTLYGFTPDTGGVPTCYGDCAAAWPPVLVDAGAAPAAGAGLDAALLGTVPRDDTDQLQVVFAGWPLYSFAGDQAAGDANGQGLNDVWFVVAADGELVMPTGLVATTEPAGYGY